MVGIAFISGSGGVSPGMSASGIEATPVVDSPTATHVVPSYSATFDGTTDCLTPESRVTLTGSISQVFASGWVKFSGTQASKHILGEYRTSSSHRMWRLATSPDGTTVEGQVYANGGSTTYKAYAFATTLNDNAWHHVAMYFNAGTLTLYLDGVADASPAKRNDSTVNSIWNGIAGYAIGAANSTIAASEFFAGDVQNARVYLGANAATAASNVAGIYADTYTGTPQAIHTLDNTLNDSSGNGYTLVDYGSIAFTLRT